MHVIFFQLFHVNYFPLSAFTTSDLLKRHLSTHDDLKCYECSVCSKMFRTKANLEEHAFVHSDVKPFHCRMCNKGFMRKPLLLTHLVVWPRKFITLRKGAEVIKWLKLTRRVTIFNDLRIPKITLFQDFVSVLVSDRKTWHWKPRSWYRIVYRTKCDSIFRPMRF